MDDTLSLDLQQTDFGREIDKEIKRLDGRIDTEADTRDAADQEIWTEIETIEAASDVVDIVGTKAELDEYDTSKLSDNDIIKVLQDETHDDAIAYYRWNDSSDEFVFIGVEGPYYTASETDTLLAGKVDKTSVTSTPSFVPMSASETLVMSQKGVASQVLNATNGGIQISSTGGNASAGSAVSVAIGPSAEAGPSPATAVGYGTKAPGSCSTALGYTAKAAGAYDIAIGSVSTKVAAGVTQTTDNLAIGSNGGSGSGPKATGGGSTAIGHGVVTASGQSSTAIGANSIAASGRGSTAIGAYSITASGDTSIAFGNSGVTASGYSSTAIGTSGITAAGSYDIVLGSNSTSTAVDSGTQTNNNVAIGTISVKANGGSSFAAGTQNIKATGYGSFAIGSRYVEATGAGSIAIGSYASSSTDATLASGSTSMAIGQYSSAIGSLSIAIGQRAVSNGNSDMAIGHNCTTTSTTATGTAAQQNIAIGQFSSATGGYSTAFGNIAVASGDTSFAVGVRANATATKSMAIGLGSPNNEVEASGFYSLAIGTNGAKASGSNSMAIGGSAVASGAYSAAIGPWNCTASYPNSVALGSHSLTGRSDEVSIGTPASGSNPEKTKYIAHVTAGVNDTDAVNVKQMNDAIAAAGGGGSQNVWYATAYGGDPPLLTATTVSGSAPFVLAAGAIVFVKFTNGSRAEFTMRQLKVDSTNAAYISSGSNFASNETVCFVYDGTNWLVVGKAMATTGYYGEVKLASNYTDNSSYTVPTSAHLHSVYTLANGKQDALTAGTGINIDANNVISVVPNNINSTDWSALWQ